MKRLSLLFFVAIIIAIGLSCEEDTPAPPIDLCETFVVDVSVEVINRPDEGLANGKIELIINAHSDNNGLTFSLNDTLYQSATTFSNLKEGGYSLFIKNTDNCKQSLDFNLTNNPLYELTVIAGSGSGHYSENERISIEGDEPLDGMKFDCWIGDTIYLDNTHAISTLIIMPDKPVQIEAKYSPVLFELIVKNGRGSGYYQENDTIIVEGDNPPEGMRFDYWIGDTIHLENSYHSHTQLIMPEKPIQIEAIFSSSLFELVVNNGTGSGFYQENEVINIEASPGVLQTFSKWTGDTSFINNIADHNTKVTMPNNSVNVTATFTEEAISYAKHIAPIITTDCRISNCHLGNGADSHYGFVQNIIDEADLVKEKVVSCDMPISGCLEQDKIDLIVKWVDAGAPNN